MHFVLISLDSCLGWDVIECQNNIDIGKIKYLHLYIGYHLPQKGYCEQTYPKLLSILMSKCHWFLLYGKCRIYVYTIPHVGYVGQIAKGTGRRHPSALPCRHHQNRTANKQTITTKITITANTASRCASYASGDLIMRNTAEQWRRSRKQHPQPLPWELPHQCSNLHLQGPIQRTRGQGWWSGAGICGCGRAVVQVVLTDLLYTIIGLVMFE